MGDPARDDDPEATLNLREGAPSPARTPPSPEAPATLGPYRLVRELGRGGQGVVYEAEDSRLGRRVALKVLAQGFAADPLTRLRFEREATAAARLDHPGICTVYEAGADAGVLFIAMRLVAGTPFSERLRHRAAATATEAGASSAGRRRATLFSEIEIVERAARALHVAHEAGLVHRDIKPANLMVEASGEPVILDFGLARDAAGPELSLTGTGTFLGTPAYMSPEQVDGTRVLDRRTDVWSLGIVLYETVTGVRPFEAPTLEGLLRAIRTGDPVPPRRHQAACTRELEAVILAALEKDPARRYQDALALAEDLRRARALEPVTARAAGPVTKAARWIQRNPAISTSVALVVLALGTGLLTALSALRTSERARGLEAKARADAVRERGRAEDLVGFLLVDMKERLAKVGRLDLLAEVAEKATRYYDDRDPDPDDPTALRNRAVAFRNAGEVRLAAGDAASAVAAFETSERLLVEHARRHPGDAQGELEAMATLAVQALYYRDVRDYDQATAYSERSLALRRQRLARHPDEVEAKRRLAGGLVLHGSILRHRNPRAALPFGAEAVELQRALVGADAADLLAARELGVALQNLGEWHRAAGDAKTGLRLRSEALERFERLSTNHPEDREFKDLLATTLHGIALLHRELGDAPTGLANARRVVPILRALLAEDPQNTQRRYKVAIALALVALLEGETGRADLALATSNECVDTWQALVALDPKRFDWRLELAEARRSVAETLGTLSRTGEAVAAARAAVEDFVALAAERARDAATHRRLVLALGVQAGLEAESGDGLGSLATTRRALAAEETRYELGGHTTPSALAAEAADAARRFADLGVFPEAVAAAARAVAMRKAVFEAADDPETRSTAEGQVLRALLTAVEVALAADDLAAAGSASDEVAARLPAFEATASNDPTLLPFKANFAAQRGLLALRSGDCGRAEAELLAGRRALDGAESSIEVRDAKALIEDTARELAAMRDPAANDRRLGPVPALVRILAAAKSSGVKAVLSALRELPADLREPLPSQRFATDVARRLVALAARTGAEGDREALLAGATRVLGLALARLRENAAPVERFVAARKDDPAGVSQAVRSRLGAFRLQRAAILAADPCWQALRQREDFRRLTGSAP